MRFTSVFNTPGGTRTQQEKQRVSDDSMTGGTPGGTDQVFEKLAAKLSEQGFDALQIRVVLTALEYACDPDAERPLNE